MDDMMERLETQTMNYFSQKQEEFEEFLNARIDKILQKIRLFSAKNLEFQFNFLQPFLHNAINVNDWSVPAKVKPDKKKPTKN